MARFTLLLYPVLIGLVADGQKFNPDIHNQQAGFHLIGYQIYIHLTGHCRQNGQAELIMYHRLSDI